jgi:hypothetical protein
MNEGELPNGWKPVEAQRQALQVELQREVGPGHELFGVPVTAVGRREDCDDVLFELRDGTNRIAVVHLTWRGSLEKDPIWPATLLFSNFRAWIEHAAAHEAVGNWDNPDC